MADDHGPLVNPKTLRGPVAAAAVAGAVAAWKGIEYLKRAVASGENGRSASPTGARPPSSAKSVDLPTGTPHQDRIDEIAERGRQIYEKLAERLKAEFLYKCVCINVDTEEFVVGDSFREVHRRFAERFGDAPSWDTRIGEAPYVFGGGGVLQ